MAWTFDERLINQFHKVNRRFFALFKNIFMGDLIALHYHCLLR